jgi:hypothetical protein
MNKSPDAIKNEVNSILSNDTIQLTSLVASIKAYISIDDLTDCETNELIRCLLIAAR